MDRITATALRPARTLVRWGVRHALPAVFLDRARAAATPSAGCSATPTVRDQPYGVYEELRARGPLVGSSLGLVTTSHGVASEVLRSDRFGVGWDRSAAPRLIRWALRFGDELDATGVAEPPSMLVVDPPDHTRFRRLVSRAFTPRATAAFEPVVQRTAEALLDALERRGGTVDLVETYAAQLPVLVIADLLGVPGERREDFLRWGAAAAATLDPGLSFRRYLAAERGLRAMHAFLREHFQRLRREPADDLVSRLVGLPPDEALTERELHATVMLLLGAGFETTVNLLGNGVVLLDAHRDQREALLADPAGWDGAVEEVLRHDSPCRSPAGRRRPTRSWPAGTCAPGRASPCSWVRPTVTPRSSTTRPASTSRGPTPATTWPSPRASTTAWAPDWRGWRAWSASVP